MHRGLLWLGLLTLAVASGMGSAFAAEPRPRVALVVGISQYKSLAPLPTTRNDAQDMAAALKNLGFEVTTVLDADADQLRNQLQDFAKTLASERQANALAVFYFAGYGLQRAGRNYMLPASFDTERDRRSLDEAAIRLDTQVFAAMTQRKGAAGAGLNIIVVDASREDPFGERPGLARVEVPAATLIAYPAEAGQKVTDAFNPKAPERNGIYARQLLRGLSAPSPGVDMLTFFKTVKSQVAAVTRNEQDPLVMSNLDGLDLASLATDNAPTLASDDERQLWLAVAKSSEWCDFEGFRTRYPGGEFAGSALALLQQLKKKIELTEAAYASLDGELKEKALQQFRDKQLQSASRCAARWNKTAARPGGALHGQAIAPWPAAASSRNGLAAVRPAVAGAWPGLWPVGWQPPRPVDLRVQRQFARLVTVADGRLVRVGTGGGVAADAGVDAAARVWVAAGPVRTPSPARSAPARGADDRLFEATQVNAEQGDVDAMYRLALMYEHGSHPVERDPGEMLRWLVLSSKLGNGLASYKLYRYFAAQLSGYAKAVRFKRLAFDQGYYGPVGLSSRR